MKNRNTGTVILILVEVIALIVVAVFSVVKGFSPKKANSFVYVDEAKKEEIPVLPEIEETEIDEPEEAETETEEEDAPEEMILEFSEEVVAKLSEMTTEEKIAQILMVTPNQLTHTNTTTAAGDITKEAIEQYPVGGFIYNGGNIVEKEQLEGMLKNTSEYMNNRIGLPALLAIEEVGGDDYSKVAIALDKNPMTSPTNLGSVGDATQAGKVSGEIAEYIKSVGFNTVIGPKADISDSDIRCYSDNADTAAAMVKASIGAYKEHGVSTIASSVKSENGELSENYKAALDSSIIMVNNTDMADTIATLRTVGYKGVIITSSMDKSVDSVVIKAINDGADMILTPKDHIATFNAILAALEDGTLAEDTLNTAVARVLSLKMD